MLSRTAAIAVAAASLVLLPGCLVNTSSRTEYSGKFISAETIKQIEPGKSKEDFVLAVLGSPTTKTPLTDGSEVWKWEYSRKKSSHGHVFLLVDADDYSDTKGATFIVMRDGVVEKTWQD